jgi:dihydropteroate synthase
MGILNITPNSFSGDALMQPGDTPEQSTARALARAQQLVADGADILDIGGESTHPAAEPIGAALELARVLPVMKALARGVRVPLSIDTYKSEVARAALDAGAQLVNDVWGLQRDPEMRRVVAQADAVVVIMHHWSHAQPERVGFISDIIRELRGQVELALDAGIKAENIWIDPGLGFGKTLEQNLAMIDRLIEFKSLGFPILIGPSRKGFISHTLQVPVEERVEGTAAAIALGIARGADVVRVHDVKAMARVAKMSDAIVRRQVTSSR